MDIVIDVSQVLSSGGNLLDAIALAIRAALIKTTLPKVDVVKGPSGAADDLDFEISDDPFAATPLAAQNVPIVVTLCKVCLHSHVCVRRLAWDCSISARQTLLWTYGRRVNGRWA